ncbi:class II aldolase/adducin family protein [Paenibacillus rhizophilus]|uniref:Class II aldolase/adducin family protein n=1 Tax=Paenibacillus rhizophilus TaxID=1850366 RepID=A0A3N9P2X2_9BACL|nr:class II aldolase/adducin family protein [Paenibacillus rhizophilus]RQW10563.1 class II aldolase/adducin family protein [Paenibacillus rhizophilus]
MSTELSTNLELMQDKYPMKFGSFEEERLHRKQRLAASFRLFSLFGFDEGVAGHITARDPEFPDHFWVNPFGMHFSQVRVSDLLLVNDEGKVVEGNSNMLNRAAFAIHSSVHKARPDAVAAAHAHSFYGKTFSSLGRLLDPLTQDACIFYNDHGLYNDYSGVVYETEEGERIAECLGSKKAVILQNHGLLTVGHSVESAAWWYITMERSCHAQLLAEGASTSPIPVAHEAALATMQHVGSETAGWCCFQPLWDKIIRLQPDFLD